MDAGTEVEINIEIFFRKREHCECYFLKMVI